MRSSLALVISTALAACSSGPPPPRVAAPPPPPARPAPPLAARDPYPALNLGFEDVDGDRPAAWTMASPGYELHAVGEVHHGGARSLRLRRSGDSEREFGAAMVQLDATPFVGKRLRVHGWIKTAEVAGGAGLWLRIDGARSALDNMDGRRIGGTAGWTEATVELDVPDGARAVVLGPLLAGTGTAWFDDLRLEVVAIEPPRAIVVEGSVVDPSGAPAAGAEVALIGSGEIAAHARADAGGRFRFETTAGRWGLSAHRAGAVGAFVDQQPFAGDARDRRIALGKAGGVTVRGRTTPKLATGAYVQISPLSQHDADLFAVPVAADGTFEAVLPRGDQYTVAVLGDQALGTRQVSRTGDLIDVTLPISVLAPPPAEVVEYIAKHAVALTTAEAGTGFADLAPIARLVGSARVVGLGEATHGTREFFQMKHRLLEYLVATQGFTVFAIEANQPECRAINDYVVNGTGSARQALAGIYFWTWNTEEVLAMIEWMRAWNADPKHTRKVQFVGFDMQAAAVAYRTVEGFLRAHAPTRADALLAPIAVLGKLDPRPAIAKAPAEERAKLAGGVAEIAKLFDGERKAWAAATSAAEFADARHDVTVLDQALRLYSADDNTADGFEIRDRSMADNIAWLMAQQPHARFVVWAHNGHIANTLATFTNMGSHLREQLGPRYVNLGFVFGEGSFQAIDMTRGTMSTLNEFTVGPPPDSNASVAFSRTGKPLLVLDLRALPGRGPVHDWFGSPHPIREIGAAFASERSMTSPLVLTALYDAVIFVDRTTRARPLTRP